MPGLGLGLWLGGSGGGGAITDAVIAQALAARNLSDAQARGAIGGAASLAAGLRAVGLMPAIITLTPAPSPTPAVTPLPGGIVALWDAASLSALADGAAVTTWTDRVGGAVAARTADSGAPHTYVASAGGLPAVRLSGAAVLATSGVNASSTAMNGGERGIVVVARNIQSAGQGQANPCLVASGTGTGLLLQATPTQTGRYGTMYDCGDPGIRTLGYSGSAARGFHMDDVNGTAIATGDAGGGHVTIGGWREAGTACCGRADILAVLVFDRAPTAADFKTIHRHYCERSGQARPGGAAARIVTCIGDSLTAGYPGPTTGNYPFRMAAGLGLAWGTWDALGVSGFTWFDIRDRTAPALGNVSGAIGQRNIVCAFEFANMRGSSGAVVAQAARTVIDALHVADPDRDVVIGSSTDDGSAAGVATRGNRADYNAYWDDPAHWAGVAAYVPLHLDPDIGAIGAAPTNGTANAFYTADNLHLASGGYALLDDGPYGFRKTVRMRLSAP